MLFNSWQFLGFFSLVFLLYFSLPHQRRALLLLIASYIFYMAWKWDYAFLMLAVTFVNFYVGKKISQTDVKKKKQCWLLLALLASLSPLIYFKYANFIIDNYLFVAKSLHIESSFTLLNVILPAGISFFTFQSLSYSIDVYHNKTKPEPNFVNFAVFIAFFPQLVAGPIERSSHLLAQFKEKHHFDSETFLAGIKLFIWGLFKKVVIADRLSLYVDSVYGNPTAHTGTTLAIATVFFAFQIYCDFSGYSDMAIGSARILGFRLMQNFNLPYLATSISDFWKKWHISLSTWFADYLYIPLGGNRVKYLRWVFNIFVVFVLSGFWHGAKWTFIVWGGLHALYYLLENGADRLLHYFAIKNIKNNKAYKLFKIVLVFILVCFAWIFFRANSITDAFIISEKIMTNWDTAIYSGSSSVTFVLSIVLILFLLVVQILQYFKIATLYFSKPQTRPVFQFMWYILLLVGITLFGISSNAFIYFQF